MEVWATTGYPNDVQSAINQMVAAEEDGIVYLPNGEYAFDPNTEIVPSIPNTAGPHNFTIAGMGLNSYQLAILHFLSLKK